MVAAAPRENAAAQDVDAVGPTKLSSDNPRKA
jgi:hypothetical protein